MTKAASAQGPNDFLDEHVDQYVWEYPANRKEGRAAFEELGTLLYNSDVGEHDEAGNRLWELFEWAKAEWHGTSSEHRKRTHSGAEAT